MSKEGGYGWLVTAASTLVHFVVAGVGYSSATFVRVYASYFARTRFEAAWIPAIILALTALAGIPSLLLTHAVGARATAVLGGALATAGFALAFLTHHFYQVHLTVGVLVGLGLGLSLTPSIIILESWFWHRHHVASTAAVSGASLGLMVLPVLTHHLEQRLAWKGMALILAGVTLHIVLAGVTFVPKDPGLPRRDSRKALLAIFNTDLLKSLAFTSLLLSNVLYGFAMSSVYTYLPEYSESLGHPLDKAMLLISICGFSALLSRVCFQIFAQTARLDAVSVLLVAVLVAALLAGLHPRLLEHFAGHIGYALMLGLHAGFWSTFLAYIVEEFIGVEHMSGGKGWVLLSVGLGYLAGPPLSGHLIDRSQGDCVVVFYAAGACLLASACLMTLVFVRKCHYRPYEWSDSDSERSAASGNRVKIENGVPCETEMLLVFGQVTSL